MNIIIRLAEPVYSLPPPKLKGLYDAIVVHDYAGERRNGQVWLPETEELALDEATHLCWQGYSRMIVWANTLGYDISPEEMDRAKLQRVQKAPTWMTSVQCGTLALPATNTVTEIETILTAIPRLQRVIAVGHWMHMRRTRYIWKKLFDGEVAVVSVGGAWDGSGHPSKYCRSDLDFLIMNLGADVMTRARGIEYMRNRTHVKIPDASAPAP